METRATPTPTDKSSKRLWLAAWLLVAALCALSILLRAPKDTRLYVNQDATWHVLHTMECYSGIPAGEHLFLPLVTPNDDARGLIWGATTPDENGLFYYTSFWPAGFVAPWLFAKIFGLAALPGTLYALNAILYAASAALCALVMLRLFGRRLHPCLVAVLAAGLFLFQPEVLQSLGPVYWHHGLNQPLLLGQFLAFLYFDKKPGKAAFFILSFLVPFVEYTGFVANLGYCLALFLLGRPDGADPATGALAWHKPGWLRRLAPALACGGLTLLSGGLTLFHYSRKLPLQQVLRAMFGSYQVRGDATRDPLLQFAAMYFRSFRWLWVLLGLMLLAALVLPAARRALPGLLKACWKPLALATFPMLENLLLRQHTVEYSYARMKAILPLLVVFFLLGCALWQAVKGRRPRARQLAAAGLAAAVLLTAGLGLFGYLKAPNRYVEVIDYMDDNARLAQRLFDDYRREDCFFGTNLLVRGYTNHLFRGGLMEWCGPEDTLEEAAERGKAYAVYVTAEWGTSNSYRFLAASVYDTATGKELALYTGNP